MTDQNHGSDSCRETSLKAIDRLHREDLVLSIIPRNDFDRALHLGCNDGSLTVRLPGQAILGVDFAETLHGSGLLREFRDDRVTFSSSLRPAGRDAWSPTDLFDLVLVSGALAPSVLGSSFPLAWSVLQVCVRPGGFVVYDREDNSPRPTLPARRLDRLSYAHGVRLNLVELYRL